MARILSRDGGYAMQIIKTGSARYNGLGRNGQGHVSTQSGVLDNQPYGFNTRFEDKPGTNPEELVAAAHASCFTMALSFALGREGFNDGTLETTAAVTLEQVGDGYSITRSALTLKGNIPGIDEAKFLELAKGAEQNCPVSKLFNAEITLDVTFEG